MTRRVAVVGASAAGLFTAQQLAARGMNVTVYEASRELAPPPRTLIVTDHLREFVSGVHQSVVNTIRRYHLITNGRITQFDLRRPDLIVERSTLIAALGENAQNAGAVLRFGRRFAGLTPSANGVTILFNGGNAAGVERVDHDTVIGADGAFSRVATAAGWPALKTAPLLQAIIPLPDDLAPDTALVWFVPDETPYFYWLIPESAQRAAVGVIGEDTRTTPRLLQRFLKRNRFEPLEFQGARIPVYSGWATVRRRVGKADVFLVGDAAGHVKVTTVGGIVTGFRGALGVVESIANQSDRRLRSLRRELQLHLLVRRTLHRFTEDDYSRLIDLLGPRAWHVLGSHTRDEAFQMLIRLCLEQPRLVLLGVRGLRRHLQFSLRPQPEF